jgi:flagellar basal-body rod modification protein FlgD
MPIDPAKALTTAPPTTAATRAADPTATSGTSGATGASGAGAASKSMMNKDDFLKLLMGQMQNQDPLNPMDPAESMGQMTQFAILEQITNLNGTQTAAASNEYDAQAVALIGKTVTYYDVATREALSGVVESVKFTSAGPELTVDGRAGIMPVSLLNVSATPPADTRRA